MIDKISISRITSD